MVAGPDTFEPVEVIPNKVEQVVACCRSPAYTTRLSRRQPSRTMLMIDQTAGGPDKIEQAAADRISLSRR